MTGSTDDERERIRERKEQELRKRLERSNGVASEDNPESSPREPLAVGDTEDLEDLIHSNRVVLVDCYADWCGPCQMLEPTIESIAANTEATVAKVDVDTNPGLAQQLGARGVPTLVLFVDGEPVERWVGVQDRSTLFSAIQQYS